MTAPGRSSAHLSLATGCPRAARPVLPGPAERRRLTGAPPAQLLPPLPGCSPASHVTRVGSLVTCCCYLSFKRSVLCERSERFFVTRRPPRRSLLRALALCGPRLPSGGSLVCGLSRLRRWCLRHGSAGSASCELLLEEREEPASAALSQTRAPGEESRVGARPPRPAEAPWILATRLPWTSVRSRLPAALVSLALCLCHRFPATSSRRASASRRVPPVRGARSVSVASVSTLGPCCPGCCLSPLLGAPCTDVVRLDGDPEVTEILFWAFLSLCLTFSSPFPRVCETRWQFPGVRLGPPRNRSQDGIKLPRLLGDTREE